MSRPEPRPRFDDLVTQLARRWEVPTVALLGDVDEPWVSAVRDEWPVVALAADGLDAARGSLGVLRRLPSGRTPRADGLRRLLSRSSVVVVCVDADELPLHELASLASDAGGEGDLRGTARFVDLGDGRPQTIALVHRRVDAPREEEDFSVLAVMPAFNEVDVIASTVSRLTDQGIAVHVLDNWSSDGTHEVLEGMADEAVTVERFPATGPAEVFEWARMLQRVEDVAEKTRATWVVFQDADEVRESPWPGVSLRDGLRRVDAAGYTCVDHTVVEFRPVDDGYVPGQDPLRHFEYFEFSRHPSHFLELKAWRRPAGRVSLVPSGGHEAVFEGRRTYPYKFLLRHYPIRSEAHGRRKVLQERADRWSKEEQQAGWHGHYGGVASFLRHRDDLLRFDGGSFHERYVVERLTGLGVREAADDYHAWREDVRACLDAVRDAVPAGATVVLVDEDLWASELLPGRSVVPFAAPGAAYSGPPRDDAEARGWLLQLRAAGATHVAIAPHAAWWTTSYPSLHLPVVHVHGDLSVLELAGESSG